MPALMSRAQAAGLRRRWAERTGIDNDDLARMLADAYLAVHGIERPEG